MASTPEPVAEPSAELPDAVNAALPGHLLRTLEWRTGLEYVSARLAMRRIAGIARFAKTDEGKFNEHYTKNSSVRRKPPQRLI